MKLATALIGISSVNLLKTFIEISSKPMPEHTIMWQLLLHLTFVVSALLLAVTDHISNCDLAGSALLQGPSLKRGRRDRGDKLKPAVNLSDVSNSVSSYRPLPS